jgi:hypothetical protein
MTKLAMLKARDKDRSVRLIAWQCLRKLFSSVQRNGQSVLLSEFEAIDWDELGESILQGLIDIPDIKQHAEDFCIYL